MMNRPTAPTPDVRIPEDRVPAILARAAELDRDRHESISVDALRTAALDAGISPSAVDAALEEYAARADARLEVSPPTTEASEERGPRFGRVRRFFRKAGAALKHPLKLGGMLFVLGLTGAAGEGMVVAGWAVWLLLSGRMIWRQRPSRRASPFALSLLFMTVGLAIGFAAAEVDEEAIAMLFAVGMPLLALGSLIIKAQLPRRFRSTSGELDAPPA